VVGLAPRASSRRVLLACWESEHLEHTWLATIVFPMPLQVWQIKAFQVAATGVPQSLDVVHRAGHADVAAGV
jgi:hypothetical protein